MDKKTFNRVIMLNRRIEFINQILARFEQQDETGCDVTVVFTTGDVGKMISDEFREGLNCLLKDYEREIKDL